MRKLRILIVDDHPHFANAFEFMLHDSFNDRIQSIDVAQNGANCLDILKEKMIDIVFMDIDMPVMNGIEATRAINDNYRDIVVIALSFHTDMNYIIKMIEAGARTYLIKEEINKKMLEDVLEKI